METIILRQARPDDYEAICILFAEGDEHHRVQHPELFQKPPGPAREKDYYLGLLMDENHLVLVAEENGNLLGAGVVLIRESPLNPVLVPRRYAVIDNLIVRSTARRRKIGQQLMERMHAWAEEKGVDSVELLVYEFNSSAQRLYEKMGYRVISRKMSVSLNRDKPSGE